MIANRTGRDMRLEVPESLVEESDDGPPPALIVACPVCGRRHYCFGGGCPEPDDESEPDYLFEHLARRGV